MSVRIGITVPDLSSHREGDTYSDADSGMTYETYVAAPGTAVAYRYIVGTSHEDVGLVTWWGFDDRTSFLAFIPASAEVFE